VRDARSGLTHDVVEPISQSEVALGLPEAVEGSHQGHADFGVGKRIFATLGYPDDCRGW